MLRVLMFSLRDLWERPLRLCLTVAGIAVAVATFIAVAGIVNAFERAVTSNIAATETQIEIIETGAVDFLSSLLPEQVATRISDVAGVSAVSPMLIRLAPVAGGSIPLLGWPEDSYLWKTIAVRQGRLPRAGAVTEVVVGANVARRLALSLGSRLTLLGISTIIVGIADVSDKINRSAIFLRMPDLQAITFRRGQATAIAVRLEPAAISRIAAIRKTIEQRAGAYSVIETARMTEANRLLKYVHALTVALSVIAIVLGLTGVINTATTLARERRHEFAVLRTLGWPVRRIALFMFGQASVVGFSGFVAGVAAGYFGSTLVARLPAVAGYLEPQLDIPLVFIAGLVCLAVSAVGTLLPVIAIARTDPATILRSP